MHTCMCITYLYHRSCIPHAPWARMMWVRTSFQSMYIHTPRRIDKKPFCFSRVSSFLFLLSPLRLSRSFLNLLIYELNKNRENKAATGSGRKIPQMLQNMYIHIHICIYIYTNIHIICIYIYI